MDRGQPTNMKQAEQYLDRLKVPPPAPVELIKLLESICEAGPVTGHRPRLSGHQPALPVEKINRIARAPFCGPTPATDLFEVVMKLGCHELNCLFTALGTTNQFSGSKNPDTPDLNRLWRHLIISAVAAATIARRINESEAVAFIAGLLHDLGKPIFAAVEHAKYARLEQRKCACGLNLSQAEQLAFGVNHAPLGAQLLTRWGLPESIVTAVRRHHEPVAPDEPGARWVALVQMANVFAHFLNKEKPLICDISMCNPNAMSLLGLPAKEIPGLVREIDNGLQRVQGFSQMPFGQLN